MRFGLIIEYDGAGFHGSQLQANLRTVQGVLEDALLSVFEAPVRPRLASRTDTGVHALGQVAAFDADTGMDGETIRKALNYFLPDDVRIRCSQRVADQFDPRRDASWREYAYTLNDAEVRPAIHRGTEVHVRGRLDEAAMAEAAKTLVGTHDFKAFAGPATPLDAPTVRRVVDTQVTRQGDRVRFSIRANAFLHQQIRRTAAALTAVGTGRMTPSEFGELVHSGSKGEANRPLAPHGLCLERILYEGEGPCGLPAAA
jgi:tRNA pseudouridine38-40 synthase